MAIRGRILKRLAVDEMTPPQVAKYISARGLYGTSVLAHRLESLFATMSPRVVACSGGVDSLLLATISRRHSPSDTVIAHACSPAVPEEATERVKKAAEREGWVLELIVADEFADERYLANPLNRCYYCKTNLYQTLTILAAKFGPQMTLLSSANPDDLSDFCPGLTAASENRVRHPFVQARIGKDGIRALAGHMNLPFADLPASPCLASRLYTGTRVTPAQLRAIEFAERFIKAGTGAAIVRCRIREQAMIVEMGQSNREKLSEGILAEVLKAAQQAEPGIASIMLDPEPYRPGKAFIGVHRDRSL